MRTIYGYTNVCYYARRPEGDTRWFATREERDEALADLREQASGAGLGDSNARSGIYPVRRDGVSPTTARRLVGA